MYSRWKLGDNVLFKRLDNYHLYIKLTIELNSKFLDAKLKNISGAYKFNVYLKNNWTSETPNRYKRNIINGSLHCSKRILSNFDE